MYGDKTSVSGKVSRVVILPYRPGCGERRWKAPRDQQLLVDKTVQRASGRQVAE